MIPYFRVPRLHLYGPFVVEPFGLLVLGGILIGIWFAHHRARQAGIPNNEIDGAAKWSLVFGLLGAHIYFVLSNRPELIEERGALVLLRFWDGLSSFGGFIGALIGVSVYFARLRKGWLRHADVLVQALVVGWVFGRFACTIAHDHIGRASDFFLTFKYPNGARHNLGFEEWLFTLLILLPATLIVHRIGKKPGIQTISVLLMYAPFRFALEFLRDGSDRFALNLEQILCVGLLCMACLLIYRQNRRTPDLHHSLTESEDRHKSGDLTGSNCIIRMR